MSSTDLPKQVCDAIEKVFSKYDKNSNNVLSYKELVTRLSENGCPEPEAAAWKMLEVYDKNGSHSISVKEVEANKLMEYMRKNERQLLKTCNDLIKKYDKNGDGIVTWKECQNYFESDPQYKDVDEARCKAEAFFKSIDLNGDDEITLTEVRTFQKKWCGNAGPQQ